MDNTTTVNITDVQNGNEVKISSLGSQFAFRLFHDSYNRTKVENIFAACGLESNLLPKISMGTNFKKSVRMNIGNDGFRNLHFVSEDKAFIIFQIDEVQKTEQTEYMTDVDGNEEQVTSLSKQFTFDSKILFDKTANRVIGTVENEIQQKVNDKINDLCGVYSQLDVRNAILKYIKRNTNAVQFITCSDVWMVPSNDCDVVKRVIQALNLLDDKNVQYRKVDIMNNEDGRKAMADSILDKFKATMIENKDRIDKFISEQKTMSPTVYKNAMTQFDNMKLILESYKTLLGEPLKECEKQLNAIQTLNNAYYTTSSAGIIQDPLKNYKDVCNMLNDDDKQQFKDNLSETLPSELVDLLDEVEL